METNRLPGHACEFETSTMLALAPERVHAADMVNEAAALATREKGERLIGPAVAGVADVLSRMIAGEAVNKPPVTFVDGQRIHMVTGDPV